MEANIWEESVVIPTYEVGAPDKNPMFLEKRVYQGSSGKLYPYPTTEVISDTKTDVTYKAVFLENDYLKIMVLPELGARIQRAYDKTNGYDFIYYNRVIKPALVGLAGPWISGGIEFNWPQHHRPTTFMPTEYIIRENKDGSKTLLCNDTDQMYGTKGIVSFTLYPDKAYIRIDGRLYNRTPLPQTFLWWANPAVSVNDDTQSIFPPDVHFVFDHGKRDVSRFPIAKGTYYKHDYSQGVDISRYKNIPVPTSYMAQTSKYDFVGNYDYGKEAGMLHVADHHFSPGKKQWTWGNGDFGKAWDRNLTDEDGPYIEIMCGVYTENQPDFSWLKPFEEKTFTQYYMPYKKVGQVSNATTEAVLGVKDTEGGLAITLYGTEVFDDVIVRVEDKNGATLYSGTTKISPVDVFTAEVEGVHLSEGLKVEVNSAVRTLVKYVYEPQKIEKAATPAEAAKKPHEILTNEELLLTATHIEQHRHATWLPDPYYVEGLKRDPKDIRINNAYGMLLYRRGQYSAAKERFEAAIERSTWRSPNPYDSECYYNLGLAELALGNDDAAYDAFYKAAWTSAQQEMSYFYLALIDCRRKNYDRALELVEKGLVKNAHNMKARALKAVILGRIGRGEDELSYIRETLAIDPFDWVSINEAIALKGYTEVEQKSLMRGFAENYLQAARDYIQMGEYHEAQLILAKCPAKSPLVDYYMGYTLKMQGQLTGANGFYKQAESDDAYLCFPNKAEDIMVLEDAIETLGTMASAKAAYYLGNIYYDRLGFDKAIALWEQSIKADDGFATVHRNLGLAYYNKRHDEELAKKELMKAYSLDESDARVFFELDMLLKKLGENVKNRLKTYEAYSEVVKKRDDAMIEWVTLYNDNEMYEKALELASSHVFRPWEGAEGKIMAQYKRAHIMLAKALMEEGKYADARKHLDDALLYPLNLGEGRLEGTKDNDIHYYMGMCAKALGDEAEAKLQFELATEGVDEPGSSMYYNDQPAEMILYKGLAHRRLGDEASACRCFNKLMDYGESHLLDKYEDDYFAVSLPTFAVLDDDMQFRHEEHCRHLMELAQIGLNEK